MDQPVFIVLESDWLVGGLGYNGHVAWRSWMTRVIWCEEACLCNQCISQWDWFLHQFDHSCDKNVDSRGYARKSGVMKVNCASCVRNGSCVQWFHWWVLCIRSQVDLCDGRAWERSASSLKSNFSESKRVKKQHYCSVCQWHVTIFWTFWCFRKGF